MKGYCRCAMCDKWYDPNGDQAKVHDHPEPQSGIYRDAWLDSSLSYEEWIRKTRAGKEWTEYKNTPKLVMIKHTFQIEADLGDGKGYVRNHQDHGNKKKAIEAIECYKNSPIFKHAKFRVVETQVLERIVE